VVRWIYFEPTVLLIAGVNVELFSSIMKYAGDVTMVINVK
jgi:hypothetical protein